MAPIPSPYFPEPIRVPNNVADGDYDTVVLFLRTVSLGHLATIPLIVLLVGLWSKPHMVQILASFTTEGVWLTTIISLALLAFLRHAALWLQIIVFALFLVSLSAAISLWWPVLVGDFPDYVQTFLWGFGGAWFGLVLYAIFAGRDYSLFGEYVLVCLAVGVSLAVLTFTSFVQFSLGFSAFVLVSGVLFYWVYDLAMIVRRRTAKEPLQAVFDLYRDLLNFVGFPIRVMRMPRGARRRA